MMGSIRNTLNTSHIIHLHNISPAIANCAQNQFPEPNRHILSSLLGTIGGGKLQSPVVLDTWPCNMVFTFKFNYLLFCNPTDKTKTETANRWGSTNSKPPGSIIMMGQSEKVIRVRSYLLHSFLHVQSSGEPCTSHYTLHTYAEAKPMSWAKPAHFEFFSSNCTV